MITRITKYLAVSAVSLSMIGSPLLALADSSTVPDTQNTNETQTCSTLTLTSGTSTLFKGITTTDPSGSSASGLFTLGTAGTAVVAGPDGYPGAWDAASSDAGVAGAAWVNNNSVAPSNPAGVGDGQDGTVNTWRLFSQPFSIPAGATVSSAELHFTADNSVNAFMDNAAVGSSAHYATVANVTPTVSAGDHEFEFVVKNDAFDAATNPTGVIYKAVINYCVPVVPVTPPAASCPDGMVQSEKLETVSVNSSSAAPTPSIAVLASGTQYLLVASGTWRNLPYNDSDAEYTSTDSWATHADGYDISPYFLGAGEFDLQVNGGFVDWGAYNAAHSYPLLYTGTGNPVNLGIFDGDSNTGVANAGWYGDNSGSLSVDIYACTPNVVQPTGGTISGMKYNDLNRNGKKDANEPGLSGWTIRLLLDGPHDSDTLVASTVTDADGNYSFTNVAPGTYDVRETHQKGWKRMSKNPKDIILTDGAVVTDVTFGNAVTRRGERGDSDKDDNHDDQHGAYYSHHDHSDYGKNQNDSKHNHEEKGDSKSNSHH